MRLQIRVDK